MSSKPAWLTLAWWREHDARLKAWFANLDREARPWTDEDTDRLVGKLGYAIGWPCLLTPLVTRWLYPWLPQPDAVLFYLWGATSLSAALLAHLKDREAKQALGKKDGPDPCSPLVHTCEPEKAELASTADQERLSGSRGAS